MAARLQGELPEAPSCKERVAAPSEGPGKTAQWGKQPVEHKQQRDFYLYYREFTASFLPKDS